MTTLITAAKETTVDQDPRYFQRPLSRLRFTTLVPEVFLEPRESREAAKTSCEAARREKPLVTLDLNLTFMQTPGSGSDPHARIG